MVKATVKRLLCFATFAALIPLSQAGAVDGVIHFTGQIVEGGCGFTPQAQTVNISCTRQGKPATYTVKINQLGRYSVQSDTPVHTDIHYLDPQHRLAVINVSYQ